MMKCLSRVASMEAPSRMPASTLAAVAFALGIFAAPVCQADLTKDFMEYFEARNKMATSGLGGDDSSATFVMCEHPSCMETVKCPVCEYGKATISEPDMGQFVGRLLKKGRAEKIDCPLCKGRGKLNMYHDPDDLVRIVSLARENFENLHITQDDGAVGYAFVPRHILDNMNKDDQSRVESKYGVPCKTCNWSGIVKCAKCKGRGILDCNGKGCKLGWVSDGGKRKTQMVTLSCGNRVPRRTTGYGENGPTVMRCQKCEGIAKIVCPECDGTRCKPCQKCNGLGYAKKTGKKRK